MESISRIFGKLDPTERPISTDQLACSAWPAAVGKKIAVKTRASKLVRTKLVVEVEDKIWQRNLFILSNQILGNLEKKLGRGLVEELEFRIVPRSIEAKRAQSSLFADEADGITDPVMRHIYKAARQKETA
jgi:hypothetical protein